MGNITDWSTDPSSGYQFNTPAPDGAPENHSVSETNNIQREVMAAVRRQWEDKEWFNFGWTFAAPLYLTENSFQVEDTYANQYTVGRRIRCGIPAPTWVYGTVVSVTAPSGGTIDVTLNMDAGEVLNASLDNVFLGAEEKAATTIKTVVLDPSIIGRNTIIPVSDDVIGLSIQKRVGSTAVLQEWNDDAGVQLTSIDDNGHVTAPLIQLDYGSATNPSITWSTDPDTGLYGSAGNVSFTASGVRRAYVNSSQLRMFVPVRTEAGSIASPSYSFDGSSTTGMYRPAANQVGFSANGALGFLVTSTYLRSYDPHRFDYGSLSTPGLAFASDPNTGIYGSSAVLSIAINGVQKASFTSSIVRITEPVRADNGQGAEPSYSFNNNPAHGMWANTDSVGIAVDGLTRLQVDVDGINVGTEDAINRLDFKRTSSIAYMRARSGTTIRVESIDSGTAWANINSSAGWTAGSDLRLKRNIRGLARGLDAVRAIDPKVFEYIKDPEGIERIGFIAQDVLPWVPQVVESVSNEDIDEGDSGPRSPNEEGQGGTRRPAKATKTDDTYSMVQGGLLPVAWNALKEIDVDVEAMKAELAQLRADVAALTS